MPVAGDEYEEGWVDDIIMASIGRIFEWSIRNEETIRCQDLDRENCKFWEVLAFGKAYFWGYCNGKKRRLLVVKFLKKGEGGGGGFFFFGIPGMPARSTY